ncbi:NmrA family NAD(P)-binding protein [Rhabdobacter roseus]|uniref:Uncharacterized protein YbjT (DUF2867 family) n=1 Tax=Rhabdobacter roseus TaxID=1655419 RepID=A0A840TQP6_9BACT|nr:NAD(P)H-binding protein [Rhabdobacter roseus]MBB5283563.1 uncharacterized protein YbjT (DUF2867 family) [Rhabdobacter roseus]
MNVILGASGQVGSAVVAALAEKQVPVRAVIRDASKAPELEKKGVEVRIADYFDANALQKAVEGGELLLVLTPESLTSDDVMGETDALVTNYREVIAATGIRQVVGLSSMGAQHASGTGNLLMSYKLEQALAGLPVQPIFVRPAYYYSNWLMYLESVREQGTLPTFFPEDLAIPMASPLDVAGFIADLISNPNREPGIYEVDGPQAYSARDVAQVLAEVLAQEVSVAPIPRESWEASFRQAGFTPDVTRHFVAMTQAVVEGKAQPERRGTISVQLGTTLNEYFKEQLT